MSGRRATGVQTSSFNPVLVLMVIAIAVMSFGALLTLMAWGPDLQPKDRAGDHAYSSSALGYGGLVKLLELRGETVNISRTPQTIDSYDGLMILTPGGAYTKLEDHLPLYRPALIILPKWYGRTDPLKKEWQVDTDIATAGRARGVLNLFDTNGDIARIRAPNIIRTPYGSFNPEFDERLQLIQSSELETVIRAPTGALLAKVPDEDVYILADPDLANTFGLANRENARLMLSILETLKYEDTTPIIFDVTLNGFERSTNLLKIMLDIPFLGATLVTLAGFLMLGWAACVRFGAPDRETRAIALGKQALADNTAGLFSMTRRETRMAPGYLALSRKQIAAALGTPKEMSETELRALLDKLGEDEASGLKWSQMADGLTHPAQSKDDLLTKARRLYRWRKEKTHGH